MRSPTAQLARYVTLVRQRVKQLAYSGPGRDRWQEPRDVIDALPVQPGGRVADIGAGAGYFTLRLARAVGDQGKVYAVDTDEDMAGLVAAEAEQRGLDNIETVLTPPDGPALPAAVDLSSSSTRSTICPSLPRTCGPSRPH